MRYDFAAGWERTDSIVVKLSVYTTTASESMADREQSWPPDFSQRGSSATLCGSFLTACPSVWPAFNLNMDRNGIAMKVKLTTKQKRDRRWKIKRRKARRLKTGL
ncbi:MAG TPA: hypothetical protein VGM98_09270 [Schlesneria sp.]